MSTRRDRLLRFVLRERDAGLQELLETWSLPVPARVDAGDAICDARVVETRADGSAVLGVPADRSRFRVGDRVRLGDGRDPGGCPEVELVARDPEAGCVTIAVPPYTRERDAIAATLATGGPFVLDRSDVDLSGPLAETVRRAFEHDGPIARQARALFDRGARASVDAAQLDDARRSLERLASGGLELADAQAEAFARARAARPLHLVQGPPGTGKTWLLALLVAALVWRGERVLVTAHTHLAVDNALLAIAGVATRFGRRVPAVRVSPRATSARRLARAGIRGCRGARGLPWPRSGGLVAGATLFSARGFVDEAPFTRVVFDEASQVPLPHALCGLLAGPVWTMFGDDRQLGPVVVGHDATDASAASIFEHLRESSEPTLLDETFRLNEPLCRFPSRAFYGGRLRPAASAASRRLALGGASPPELRAVIDEPEGPVLVRIDHVGYRSVCPPERDAAVEIAAELLGRRGLPARELAIVAPFRIQNAEIARELARRLGGEAELPTIDTVERVQGQEREVVIVSLTCSDPDALRDEGRFLFSPHRLNVSLTRARTRLVVLASRRLLDAWPRDLAGLQQVDVFHRLFAELPQVDWSGRYDS